MRGMVGYHILDEWLVMNIDGYVHMCITSIQRPKPGRPKRALGPAHDSSVYKCLHASLSSEAEAHMHECLVTLCLRI